MAKKSFKSGLDNLLASAGIKKKNIPAEEPKKTENKDTDTISEEKKLLLAVKIERLEKELALWRTGKLSVKEFHESLGRFGLSYNPETNIITEK
ncbi:MAG: hypothetical protein GXO50_00465 [Chlorobi bacterium]|nr:hypothetical protein [Chlorobiota bacterium]